MKIMSILVYLQLQFPVPVNCQAECRHGLTFKVKKKLMVSSLDFHRSYLPGDKQPHFTSYRIHVITCGQYTYNMSHGFQARGTGTVKLRTKTSDEHLQNLENCDSLIIFHDDVDALVSQIP